MRSCSSSSSGSLLARVTPAGREGEIFGLYATTGRAASFLSPLLWAGFIVALGATFWGILGIVLVLAAGLVLVLLVRNARIEPTPADGRADSGLAGLAAFLSVVLSSSGWIVYLGVFPTAIGFVTWAFALNRTSAGRLGSTTYLV